MARIFVAPGAGFEERAREVADGLAVPTPVSHGWFNLCGEFGRTEPVAMEHHVICGQLADMVGPQGFTQLPHVLVLVGLPPTFPEGVGSLDTLLANFGEDQVDDKYTHENRRTALLTMGNDGSISASESWGWCSDSCNYVARWILCLDMDAEAYDLADGVLALVKLRGSPPKRSLGSLFPPTFRVTG